MALWCVLNTFCSPSLSDNGVVVSAVLIWELFHNPISFAARISHVFQRKASLCCFDDSRSCCHFPIWLVVFFVTLHFQNINSGTLLLAVPFCLPSLLVGFVPAESMSCM